MQFYADKRGQITIFIILSLIIVIVIGGFFVIKNNLVDEKITADMQPIYEDFLVCLEDKTLVGIDLLETQAGYISLPDFEPGSSYMPFSSHLDFLGNPIPYWYYVSGNNLKKEQVPSKQEMEIQLGDFIDEKIKRCVFDKYYEQGFQISVGNSKTEVKIRENNVEVELEMDLSISKGSDSAVVQKHKILVDSRLGKLYDSAKKVYDYEKEKLFLENYAVDILRLYAPVDGVELSCSPLTWNAKNVFEDLQEAIEINTLALRLKGNDYSLTKEENKYFVVDIGVDEEVNFLTSKNWPRGFEVAPSESSMLIANPIGNQPGLGILGFCYVPYHFVYNLRYPVLIQVSDKGEIFQFPFAVVIQSNKPVESSSKGAVAVEVPDVCKYKNTPLKVTAYDMQLNKISANISYDCFGEICNIGKTTSSSSLQKNFPQCVNGKLLAKSNGFEDASIVYSTNEPGEVSIFLDRLYDLNFVLKVDGKPYGGNSIVSFVSNASSKTIVYPTQNSVELSEGQYEIQVQVYENSSLKLEETTYEQCVEVPSSGIGGLFGLTKEKCFDVKMPSQIISNALSGGGKQSYYILESELRNSNKIELNVESFDSPSSIEDLQNNYLFFEEAGMEVGFK